MSARKAANISQAKASAKLGYPSPQYLSNIERGKSGPSHEVIRKLIKIYGLNESQVIEDLIDLQSEYLRAEIKGVLVSDK
jgi:transcriptional regulator with XRE-family HTH domain